MKPKAEIIEIGPREGLQSYQKYISTESKLSLINMLFDAGFRKVEITSLVHPKAIPQMRDAVDIIQKVKEKPGKIGQVLVPNEMGCRNAVACQADEIVVWIFLTDELSYLTQNRSRTETFKEIRSIIEIAHLNNIKVCAYIGAAFGYPGMNYSICQEVKGLAAKLLKLGCYEVCLNDEFCMANPILIKKDIRFYLDEIESSKLAVHFHDNKGLGLANIITAYEEGIRTFKTCIGGAGVHTELESLRGKASHQNHLFSVPTEDLVYVFEEMGINTGVDIDKLAECGRFAENLLRAGLNSFIIKNNLSSQTINYLRKLP